MPGEPPSDPGMCVTRSLVHHVPSEMAAKLPSRFAVRKHAPRKAPHILPLIDDPVEKAAFWDRMGQSYADHDQMDRAALAYLRALKLQPDNERYRISAEMLLDTLEDESVSPP